MHYLEVHSEKRYTCSLCSKSLSSSFKLKSHIDSIHKGIKKIVPKRSFIKRALTTARMRSTKDLDSFGQQVLVTISTFTHNVARSTLNMLVIYYTGIFYNTKIPVKNDQCIQGTP